jgi:DNA-binding winged helix-turn-helix (wHTH) protein
MPSVPDQVTRFAGFELDPRNGVLRKNGTVIKLSAQPFKALVFLASRPQQLVTREELQHAVWGHEVTVEFEHGLNTCIRQIRVALGEDAERARIIETVPRLGYRFKADTRSVWTRLGRTWRIASLLVAALAVGALVLRIARPGQAISTRAGRARMSTFRLPTAKVGIPYSFSLGRMYPSVAATSSVGGHPVQVTGWAASGLPPGLKVDFSGHVTGMPTAAGRYSPTLLLMHRSWVDTNGNGVPDCDLSTVVPNGECGPSSTTNPLEMAYELAVDP